MKKITADWAGGKVRFKTIAAASEFASIQSIGGGEVVVTEATDVEMSHITFRDGLQYDVAATVFDDRAYTLSGVPIDLLNPTPEMIDWNDIAVALSHEVRFNGMTMIPFSVAQHTLAMLEYCEQIGLDKEVQLVVLIHDAAEAYLKDIPVHLKEYLGEPYRMLEVAWERAICASAGIFYGRFQKVMEQIVKPIDRMAAIAESAELQPDRPPFGPVDPLMAKCVKYWIPNNLESWQTFTRKRKGLFG